MSRISDLLGFTKINGGKKGKIQLFLVVSFVDILVTFLCGIIIIKLFDVNKLPVSPVSSLLECSVYKQIILIVLIGPFVEEMIFRKGLSFKKSDVIISMLFVIPFFLRKMIWGNYYLIVLTILSVLFLCFYLMRFTTQSNYSNMKEKYGSLIITISLLAFTWLHFVDFNIIEVQWVPFYIIKLFPIFLGGILLTLIRLKVGFGAGVLYHCLHNAFFIGFIILSK
jgi:hypothetical protein